MSDLTVRFFGPQFDAFNFETQYGCACAGVQSGKTFLGAHWAIKKMLEFPDKSGLIVAPTHNILRAATLKKLFELHPDLMKHYKEQKGEIVLPTGGTVFVRSADNPLGIEGMSPHWIWLDEGGQCSQLTWTVLRSRVAMTRGQILITTTPYNMGWLYTEFYMPWKEKTDKNLSFFTWKAIDNPHYSVEHYESERRRLSPEEFSRRYEGEFRKMTGLVWDLPDSQIVEELPKSIKTEARIMGVDWGYRNPAAISVIYIRDKEYYVVDEWKAAERTTAEIVQVVTNKIKEHHVTAVYPDPAEPDRIHELKVARVPTYEANKDVVGGISMVATLIREKRFFVTNNCVETIDEMSMYHYPESLADEQREEKELPYKWNDHLMDAIRYPIYSFKPMGKIPIASSSVKKYYPELGI